MHFSLEFVEIPEDDNRLRLLVYHSGAVFEPDTDPNYAYLGYVIVTKNGIGYAAIDSSMLTESEVNEVREIIRKDAGLYIQLCRSKLLNRKRI